jgi:hypothetical protein
MSLENVVMIFIIFLSLWYIQAQQKQNWIIAFVGLICFSYLVFSIENEFMLQLMLFLLNFVNCIAHLFNIYSTSQNKKKK